MRIVVDTNTGEDGVFARLVAKYGDAVSRARLDVGDILLEGGTPTKRLVIERKSWADLISSVADGRYGEQKARQFAAVDGGDTAVVVWLVQGPLRTWHATASAFTGGTTVGRIEAAVIGTAVGDGIPVLRAADEEAVAETVAVLVDKMEANHLDGAARAQARAALGYAGMVKVRKSANVDTDSTWRGMLASVRGMSAVRAKSVTDVHATAAKLVSSLVGKTHKVAIKELADIPVGDKRLGPALGKRLLEIFGQ